MKQVELHVGDGIDVSGLLLRPSDARICYVMRMVPARGCTTGPWRRWRPILRRAP